MLVVELFDDLGRQLLRQPLVEARAGRQSLQAAVLYVLGDQRYASGHLTLTPGPCEVSVQPPHLESRSAT